MHRSNLLSAAVSRRSIVSAARYVCLAGSIVANIVALSTVAVAQQASSAASPQAPPSTEQRPDRPTSRDDTVYNYRAHDSGPAARMPGCPADTECAPRARATRVPQ
jgi:hypothetical protein